MNRDRLLILVEIGIMVALFAVLNQVKLFKLPQGGSVTAGSMIPLLLIGLRHGLKWGVVAGLLAGTVDYLLGGYTVHPVQVLLDYPVAFGALGLAGLAAGRSNWQAAALGSLALAGRFAAHLVSGVVFFSQYAPEGQNVWLYSAIYNGSYILPEMVISGVLLVMLLPALERAVPVRSRTAA